MTVSTLTLSSRKIRKTKMDKEPHFKEKENEGEEKTEAKLIRYQERHLKTADVPDYQLLVNQY